MKNTMSIELHGDKALMRAMNLLPDKVYNKVVKQAVNQAATPIRKQAQKNAPVGKTGNLKRNIIKKSKLYKNQAVVLSVVGGQYKKDPSEEGSANHAHLVEFGHGGPKPAPPHPFMRPAFDATKGKAEAKLRRAIGKGVEREAAKLNRK